MTPRPPRVCDLLGPPAPVTDLTATAAGGNVVDVAFTRPAQPKLPAHARAQREGYVAALAAGACPPRDPYRPEWDVPVGGRQTTQLFADAPGTHCVSVWAQDGAGRLSAPATLTVEVT